LLESIDITALSSAQAATYI